MKTCAVGETPEPIELAVEHSPLMLNMLEASESDAALRRVLYRWNHHAITALFDPRVPVEDCLCETDVHSGTIAMERNKQGPGNIILADLPFEAGPPTSHNIQTPKGDPPPVLFHETATRLVYHMDGTPGLESMALTRYTVSLLVGGRFPVEPVVSKLGQALRKSGCPEFEFENADEAGKIYPQANTGHYL